ncbi:type II secretion system F family protein [Eggerthella sp.]|uniref:type II secretion system F family protein n=1 Tax=Eggerthella sp. TaxID=1929886 RepID=UPI003AB23F8A
MGGSLSNIVNLLPALPGLALGVAMLVSARRGRIAREQAGVESADERPSGKVAAVLVSVCEQASPQLSVQEAEIVWAATAMLPALTALALGVGPLSLLLLPVCAAGFPLYLKVRRDSGKKKFEEQLGQAMPLIASNLRAGSSVAQAIGPVAENMSDPIKSEFRRLTSDIRAGTPVPEALDKVADRTGSRDLRLFATAVDISQQTGGSLADITENVGQTVRARVEARKAIRSKTSLNRIESQIMVGLPVFMMAALLAISPSHREFYSQPSGWALIALAVVLDALAYLMMRKMGDVKLD